jgi:hypothetical protein
MRGVERFRGVAWQSKVKENDEQGQRKKTKELDQVLKRRKGTRRGVERLRRRSLVKQYM